MWSWDAWKGRIIWLRDAALMPLGAVWTKAQSWPAGSVVVAAIVLGVVYWAKTPIWDFLNHADRDGKIFVNSPTVYTRQRLVNDRLDQASWLRTQLQYTEGTREHLFKSIDEFKSVSANTQARAGASDDAKPLENAPPSSVAVEPTTAALFRAKNAYRDEVRSEITQTELDDRHDIKGNTIYRLEFDTSVLAGTRSESIAGISIKLSHHPDMAKDANKEVYDDDYKRLYEDWARYFQDTIGKSLAAVPASIASPDPNPQLRILFSEFLLRRICQFARNDADLANDPAPCSDDDRRSAEALLADYNRQRFNTLIASKRFAFMASIAGYASSGYQLPPSISPQPTAQPAPAGNPPNSFAPLFDTAYLKCADSHRTEIALWELGIKSPPKPRANDSAATKAPGPQDKAGDEAYAAESANEDLPQNLIGCPFYDSLPERLISGALLYENLYEQAKAAAKPIAVGEYAEHKKKALAEVMDCGQGACSVVPSRLRCFAADFIKSSLNSFSDLEVPEWQKVRHYLRLRIVGRNVNDCNVLVSALPNPSMDEKQKPYSPLKEFVDHLNTGTDAFAYSVTPKNLTENISTAAQTRDALQVMLRAPTDSKDVVSLLRQRAEQDQAVVAHPIVVGFGTPNDAKQMQDAKLVGIRDVDFGWIVAPHARVGGGYEQMDGQYPLIAFISVPGWWRTVELEIRTCWLARRSLDLKSAEDICPPTSKISPINFTVRLPTAIPEISRKLGFDVVRQPSLYTQTSRELTVGRSGSLLLEGQRLWRSTEVTAAAQRADKISVLPNMEGILAEFKCVAPPPGQQHYRHNNQLNVDEKVITDWVRVWTSEGVTDPLPVDFILPSGWEVQLAACRIAAGAGGPTPPVAQSTTKKTDATAPPEPAPMSIRSKQ